MTTVILNRSVFQKTLAAFQGKFDLTSPDATLLTEPSGEAFRLTATQKNGGQQVQAFGACSVQGDPVQVVFNMADLSHAIDEAFGPLPGEANAADRPAAEGTIAANQLPLTLLIGDGIWVKDPTLFVDEGA